MKISEKGFDRYAEIKITTTDSCQSCGEEFKGPEVVFYAAIDNNILCRTCAKAHAEVAPRLYAGEE